MIGVFIFGFVAGMTALFFGFLVYCAANMKPPKPPDNIPEDYYIK